MRKASGFLKIARYRSIGRAAPKRSPSTLHDLRAGKEVLDHLGDDVDRVAAVHVHHDHGIRCRTGQAEDDGRSLPEPLLERVVPERRIVCREAPKDRPRSRYADRPR